MSLSIVVGSSGSGKSTTLYSRIIKESIKNKDKNYLIIVPEQYTMATQRLLVQMHPNKCIMNIDVLSFDRLAYRVFEELSAGVNAILDDTGKSLVIRKLINNHLKELKTLNRNITKISYIVQVKSLISELTQYNITVDKLKDMIASPAMSESFRRKASDLLVLYEAFLDFINGRYVTTESILSTLNDLLDDSSIVRNSTVVLDGFTGFTPIQYQLVEHMLDICDEVAVTITADNEKALLENLEEDALFSMSSEFAIKLNKIAKRKAIEINPVVMISADNGWLSENKVLSHLERNIFRDSIEEYSGKDASDSIVLTSCRNMRDELRYVAIQINRLVRNGMHYKDIAVVTPNLEAYRYLASELFMEYKIPYFIDAKTEILFSPMSEALAAIFDIFERDFRREDVFRFLRSGLVDIKLEDVDYLENYLISTGIRGKKKYFHPFAIRSNQFSEDDDLLRVNQIRESIIKPFIELDKILDDKNLTVRSIATALYNFMVSFDFEGKLKLRGQMYEDRNDAVRAKEYSQIYQVIMDILDKLVGILGDEPMTLKEFHDIYEAGLSAASIGVIPPANDSVIFGDIERTRLSNIKVLFCMGASDDAIPKKVENGGILSQLEREQLLALGFELAPSDRQKSFRQRFYLYLMLTKPNERLYITMPRVDGDGKGVNPSYLIDTIKQLFSEVKLEEIQEFTSDDRMLSKTSCLIYLTELMNKAVTYGLASLGEEEYKDFTNLLLWAKDYAKEPLERLLNGTFYEHHKESFSEDVMNAVNEALNADEVISGSISKFELYNECSYKYFLTYILKLKEREQFELSSIDMGNFYHEAIERYSRALKDDNKKFRDVTPEERDKYIDVAIAQTFESMAKVVTLEDYTQRYIVEGMKNTLRYVVDVITVQVSRGEFEPELFEEEITSQIYDENSNELLANLKGKVDRIDLTNSDDKAVRIIDYKSSGHKLDLSECYHGLSLQLPIYMGVVVDKLKEKYPKSSFHPSAMLYYELANKFLETWADNSSADEERIKLNKMEGLLSLEEDDLRANDSTVGLSEGQSKESSIVPYGIKSKGEISAKTNAVSLEDMLTVIDYSMLSAAKTAGSIIEGEFEPSPARLGTHIDACKFCNYKSVCHFNENEPGFTARNFAKAKNNSEIIDLMKKELGEDTSATD